ncbi:MAG: universal stress protein [Hyphomonadaceae bacterium]|nr:universal stress protein [Hyphomonadaceae bacterium]
MKLRDILAIVASGSPQDSVVALSQQLCTQNRGRISGLAVSSMPVLVMTEGWVASPVWEDVRKHARTSLETVREQLQRRLEAEQTPGVVAGELLEDGQAPSTIAARARHHDVSVVGCPRTDTEQSILEAALFGSGRPVLLAPQAWVPRPIGERVVVAWKPTRQAARALSDAEDLLLQACRTIVLTVDMDHTEDECRRSGGEIAAHLERRGVKAEACAIAPIGRTEARAVLDHAAAIDADLIVMGGFGRSRMSEFIFGGMTREMVRTATIPVLMSH